MAAMSALDLLAQVCVDLLERRNEIGKKRTGPLSNSSSDSQMTGKFNPLTHALTQVIFPKPAGVETSVTCRPDTGPFVQAVEAGIILLIT